MDLQSRVLKGPPRQLSAVAGERAHVGGEVDLGGADLARHFDQLALRPAVTHHQAAAALLERAVEVRQALEQELRPRARGVAAVQEAVVEAEDRHDPLVALQRHAQCRVVVHAQVAAVPEERGHRDGYVAPATDDQKSGRQAAHKPKSLDKR
jgi:hypothetical protein